MFISVSFTKADKDLYDYILSQVDGERVKAKVVKAMLREAMKQRLKKK